MANGTPNKNSGRNSTVAIELGTSVLRAVEIGWTGSQEGQVLGKGQANLPPQFWQNTSQQPAYLTSAINEALGNGRIGGKSVTITLPRHLVTVRYARLPHAEPEQMRSMVTYEAQQYILFPLDEVILDYCTLPEPAMGDELQTVLLVATRRSLVQEIVASCDRAGRQVDRITVSSLALAEHLHSMTEPTALVHFDAGTLEMVVVSNRAVIFSRSALVDPNGTRLRDEVLRTFVAYQNEQGSLPLAQVRVSGDASQLVPLLRDLLDVPVEPLRARILAPTDSTALAVAVGASLQGSTESIGSINLVPTERAEKRAEGMRRRNNALALTVGFVAVASSVLFVKKQLDAQERDMRTRKQANKDLQDVTERLTIRKKMVENDLSLKRDLEEGLARKHPVVDILVAISRALPTTGETWLTQLSAERSGTITLRGDTKSEAAPTEIVLALQQTGGFSEVHLGYLGEAQTSSAKPSPTKPPVQSGSAPTLPGLPSNKPITPPTNTPPGNTPPPNKPGGMPAHPNPNPIQAMPQGVPGPPPAHQPPTRLMPGGLPPGFNGGPLRLTPPPPTNTTTESDAPVMIENPGGPRVKQMPPFTDLVNQAPPKGVVIIRGTALPQPKVVTATKLATPPVVTLKPSVKSPVVEKPVAKKTTEKPSEQPNVNARRMSFVITFKVNPAVIDLLTAPKSKGNADED